MSFFKRYVLQHRNNKFLYYAKGVLRDLYPSSILRARLAKKVLSYEPDEFQYIQSRVDYYNKITSPFVLPESTTRISELKNHRKGKVYYFDSVEYARYFNPNFRLGYSFGDIIHVPDVPSIVKSRPIREGNSNSVLLKLNKVRHYTFVNDDISYGKKKDQLVWRGFVAQPHRKKFMQMYFTHPLCDLGKINDDETYPEWLNGWISINKHLTYKFILTLEGNDIATNLKWVMSSNSIAVMPRPRHESWFMESRLVPDHHYIEIDADYKNLEEKLEYFIANPEEAMAIVKNANDFVEQFKKKEREDQLSLLVLERYFVCSGQMDPISVFNAGSVLR